MNKKTQIKSLLLLFLFLFSNIFVSSAESNHLIFFGFNKDDNYFYVNYETAWGNTTISLKDNNTQLFLANSTYISFSEEGNSTWESVIDLD